MADGLIKMYTDKGYSPEEIPLWKYFNTKDDMDLEFHVQSVVDSE